MKYEFQLHCASDKTKINRSRLKREVKRADHFDGNRLFDILSLNIIIQTAIMELILCCFFLFSFLSNSAETMRAQIGVSLVLMLAIVIMIDESVATVVKPCQGKTEEQSYFI